MLCSPKAIDPEAMKAEYIARRRGPLLKSLATLLGEVGAPRGIYVENNPSSQPKWARISLSGHMSKSDEFLSDADKALIAREFETTDPHQTIDNLVARIPPEAINGEMPHILFRYDATPPGGRKAGHSPHLECGFGHPQKHWTGYVFEFANGMRAKVGQHCAAEHFGPACQAVENAFFAKVDRKAALQRVLALRDCLPAALIELRDLENMEAVREFRLHWKTLTKEFSALAHLLGQLDQGRLIFNERTRDRAEEERQARQEDPELFAKTQRSDSDHLKERAQKRWEKFVELGPPIWRQRSVDYGQCEAFHLLKRWHDLERLLREAIALAEKQEAVLLESTSQDWEKRQLNECERVLKDALSKLDEALWLLADLKTFAAATNMQRVVAWDNAHLEPAARLAIDGATLVNSQTGARLALSASFALPQTPRLDILRSVLGVQPVRQVN